MPASHTSHSPLPAAGLDPAVPATRKLLNPLLERHLNVQHVPFWSAGLDPAVPATRQLVDKLLAQRDMAPASAHHQRISFDNFMKVRMRG